MRNENQNPGMELNDAALDGVSGGYGTDAIDWIFCRNCEAKGVSSRCKGGAAQLAEYIKQRGGILLPSSEYCPFLVK